MAKKNKTCSLDRAKQVIALCDSFENTAKGDNDRGHFSPIVETSIRSNLTTKDEAATQGISKDMSSNALRGMPTGASTDSRNHFIGFIRGKAEAVVATKSAPAPAGQ